MPRFVKPLSLRFSLVASSLALLGMMATSAPASAQWGSGGGSLYSEDGVEITIDRRVIAVFTVLNALGYDKEVHFGSAPLFLPEYSEGRTAGRKALRRAGISLKDLAKIVAKHPVDVDKYVEAALQLGGAPRFTPGPGASKLAKALSKDLASWYNEESGKSAVDAAIKRTVKAQKALLQPVNKTTKKITKLINMGGEEDQLLEEDEAAEAGRVTIVLNPMDVHDTLYNIDGVALSYVVSGPTKAKAPVKTLAAVAHAYARQIMRHEVGLFVKSPASKGTLVDRYAALSAKAKKAAGSKTGYVLDLLSCGLVSAVLPKMACDAASLDDDAGKAALAALAPRAKSYTEDTALFKDILPELMGVAAAEPAPVKGAVPAPAAGAVKAAAATPPAAAATPAAKAPKAAAAPRKP
ncbi:MAG: hypothetical protein GY822_01250 [Deltaproteobacteria bacterium]|nr:hypothetical protein [Deltaproteobacteria bacterium]